MTENFFGTIVLVIPYQRNLQSITMLECVLANDSSIGQSKSAFVAHPEKS
jgi:hypothetical protein